jgi:hypothetical protein
MTVAEMSEGFNITEKINATVAKVRTELSGYPSLSELEQQIAAIPARMKEPMQLAIVGKISSSKSTLVNAILGEAEVVRTGAMEETWNVSWLKYGNPDSPVVVHYKDENRQSETVARNRWAEWANRRREGNEQLKNAVSYIEVAYPHEILKQINIIDTPGLDSFYGADSQNTLDFLKQVKPDAVIMLFSKNINADTLSVIEDFRQGIGSGFSPINAMGVMSKIDDIWASDPDLEPLAEGRRIIGSLMSQEAVKNALFNIYPVSAFTALAAFRMTDEDLTALRKLSELPEDALSRIFKSEKRFVTGYEDVPVSADKRAGLLSVYGRYGAWLIVDRMKRQPAETRLVEALRNLLQQKSGYRDFMEILQNHFGEQSALIKVYSLILGLSYSIRKFGEKFPGSSQEKWIIGNVIRETDGLIRTLTIQFNVIDLAKAYYEGRLDITPEEFDELRRINGEFGYSCIERTGLDVSATPQEMLDVCMERLKFWRGLLNTKGKFRPSMAPFMKQMIGSYSALADDIASAKYKLEASTKFLFGQK